MTPLLMKLVEARNNSLAQYKGQTYPEASVSVGSDW